MTWCLNEYSDIFRCLLCWTVLPNVIFFLFTRAFQRIGSINCIYQQPSFQGGSVVFSHVQSEQRTNFGCLPPAKNRTFHQAQRQVRCGKKFPEKNMTFSTKGLAIFLHPPTDHCHIRHIPTQPDMFEVDDFVSPVSPRFRRGFRCHPVSQRAGVLRSGVQSSSRSSFCCTVSLNKKHGKNFMGNTIVVFGMLGIFPIYPDISKNCFWPGFFVDGNAFSNLWFRKVANVLEGSGGICKVGVLQQIWFPPSRRQLL